MLDDNSNVGEQALSKAAEVGLSSQLDEVERLKVEVKTDPLKAVQGELDGVAIEGEGMVMQHDLRVEAMDMQTGSIAINPLAAAFGKIELQQPTEATAHVVLTEQDMNRAFNSQYLREKLQNIAVQIDGQLVTINTQQVDFQLPEKGKVRIDAQIAAQETGETQQVSFSAVPEVDTNGQRIQLQDVQYTEGKEVSPKLTEALLEKTSELLDLRNFELEGMSLRLQGFDIESGKLTLNAAASVRQFPSS